MDERSLRQAYQYAKSQTEGQSATELRINAVTSMSETDRSFSTISEEIEIKENANVNRLLRQQLRITDVKPNGETEFAIDLNYDGINDKAFVTLREHDTFDALTGFFSRSQMTCYYFDLGPKSGIDLVYLSTINSFSKTSPSDTISE
ncbi:MAG: hypothetical protein WC890_01965 [Candidatus Margulisiibacteriota bacterium]